MAKERGARPILFTIASMLITLAVVLTAQAHPMEAAPTDSSHAEPSPVNTIAKQNSSEATLANCRYGVTSAEQTAHFVPTSGAGVFYKFNQPNWYGPLPDNDAELLHMIKTRQRKTSTGEYLQEWYIPGYRLDDELAGYILDDLGAVWIIGNEVERGPNPGETWTARTGDMYPDIYAEAYHDIYHFIKAIDPTARVANAGLIQVTPMRLQYLNKMWDAYKSKYGEDMPVDVWTIHTYVLPELTPEGLPNNVASAALSTDLNLGKRASGGNAANCPSEMVYCSSEHDELSILKDQIVSMRQWMKNHGQRNKPLIITEYGTLYHYRIKDNGSCGMKDEFGNCFTPERVTKFLLDSFEYLNNEGRDANLGLAGDDNRLVQQWIWYGVWEWDIGSSNLLTEWNSTEMTMIGKAYRDHIYAEQTYVNLAIDEVSSNVIVYEDDETSTAKLAVSFRNNGNVPVEKSFQVTFYSDAALTKVIESTTISAKIRGCASRAYIAEVEWSNLEQGVHPFWVKIDSGNQIDEKPVNDADNIGSGEVQATGPVYTLDIEIISDGIGTGGVVTSDPNSETHSEGAAVKLTAVPFTGWSFTGWSGAIIGNSPTAVITMQEDIKVSARFTQEHFELDIGIAGEGQVLVRPEPQQDYYLYGDAVELLAVAEEGWQFSGWSRDIVNGDPKILIIIEENVSVKATFDELIENLKGNVFMPVTLGN